MLKSLNIIWQYLRAFVLIYACLYAGIFIASLLADYHSRQHYRDADPLHSARAANSARQMG
ncbi:Uncharacterised protein [Kluyvera cryocrescens]|uniref:Uncharacterized protein n=1 Tax=Kluyvera cryocrescens TaxID=580 RepID=A0A485BU99_KLUCR|nr:Uncharacterised protein [Kluyvera cryocrescens]